MAGSDGAASVLVELGTASQIFAISLRIFDGSFAVTYWLRAVAIAIDMFGVAANFSARVLSWRKEFDQLAHLVPTRRQILQLVALGPPAVVPGCGADRHGDRRAGRERRLVNGNQAVCWRLRQPIPSSKATSTASAARVMSGT